jgi:hypothetical protein
MNNAMNEETPKQHHIPTSVVLQNIASRMQDGYAIEDMARDMGGIAFGLCMLIFALPNIVPIPLPGLSTLTAIPMLYFSVQLMFGKRVVWLPNRVGKRKLQGEKVQHMIEYVIPWVARFERYFRPRLRSFAVHRARMVAGGIITMLALLIALPVPFGNWMPALAVCVLCLAIIEYDGVLMIIGYFTTILALIYLYFLFSAYFWLLAKSFEAITGMKLIDDTPPAG